MRFRFNSEILDDLIFEHRNKEYGAYELRKTQNGRLIKSFFSALLLVVTVVSIQILIDLLSKKPKPDNQKYVSTIIDMKKNYVVEQENDLLPLPITHQKLSNADVPLMVVKDSLVSKKEIKKDTLKKISESTAYASTNRDSALGNNKDTSVTIESSTASGTTLVASAIPFNLVSLENIPQFQGGNAAMMKFFEKNIHYNEQAKSSGICGKIYASFVINSKGEIESVKIQRGLGYGLDEEVMRVLSILPKWEPWYYKGKPVSTVLNIPVSFSLIQ